LFVQAPLLGFSLQVFGRTGNMEHLIEEMKRQTQICIKKVVHTSFRFSARCSNRKLKPEAALLRAAVRGVVLALLQHMKRKSFCVDAMVKNK
jgi:hypothetical protein